MPGVLVLVPGNIAEKVRAGEMRRGGDVSIGQLIPREPIPRRGEPADVAQMETDVAARRSDQLHVGTAAAALGWNEAFVDLLVNEIARDLQKEFLVEPIEQTPDLQPRARRLGQEATFRERKAARLVQVFGDDSGSDRRRAVLHKNGSGSRRIEAEKAFPALEWALLDQLRLHAVFGERRSHET